MHILSNKTIGIFHRYHKRLVIARFIEKPRDLIALLRSAHKLLLVNKALLPKKILQRSRLGDFGGFGLSYRWYGSIRELSCIELSTDIGGIVLKADPVRRIWRRKLTPISEFVLGEQMEGISWLGAEKKDQTHRFGLPFPETMSVACSKAMVYRVLRGNSI